MQLTIDPFVVLVHQLDAVTQVTMHESIAVRDASIAHEHHDLMDGLWVLRQIVPEHGTVVGVGQVCGGIALLGMDEVGEFGRISQKEDWRVIGHDVPVSLFGPHFDRESSWITSQVVGARLAPDGGEAYGDGAFLAFCAKYIGQT